MAQKCGTDVGFSYSLARPEGSHLLRIHLQLILKFYAIFQRICVFLDEGEKFLYQRI